LAHFYTHIGKFKEADQLFKQAFSILSVSFSNKQFFINISKIYIGSNNYMLGNIKHARTLLEEAIPYLDDSDSGYWHWFPRLHLARVYEQAGEYDKALMFIRESLILAKKFYKEKLHDSMAFQLSRAETWRKLYKTTSMTYWKEKLELTIQLFGKNHHQTARYHQLYGQALANRQQLKAAKEQYEKAMAILDKEEIKHPALIKFHQQNMQILQELIKESKV
jgi:tetratricopeptide (TPR) repeat protein